MGLLQDFEAAGLNVNQLGPALLMMAAGRQDGAQAAGMGRLDRAALIQGSKQGVHPGAIGKGEAVWNGGKGRWQTERGADYVSPGDTFGYGAMRGKSLAESINPEMATKALMGQRTTAAGGPGEFTPTSAPPAAPPAAPQTAQPVSAPEYGPNPTTPGPRPPAPAGYGLSGFGIPGFENSPMVGGGSWQGVTWQPWAQRFDMQYPYNAQSGGPQGAQNKGDDAGMGDIPDPNNPNNPGNPNNPNGPPTVGDGSGIQIPLAQPYDYSNYTQFYGNHLPPFMNLQQQIEQSMKGIAPAKPTNTWANMAPTGWAGPGWASMLGFNAPTGGRPGG